jgi:L-lactate dehydrogenase complex protein LldF
MPEWEQLRVLASGIKEHTLTHLGDYLEQFERNATANGMVVHWARDAAEHNQIVFDILACAPGDDAGQEQVDADRRSARCGPSSRTAASRSSRPTSGNASSSSTTSRPATSSCRRCTSCARRGEVFAARSAPTRRTSDVPYLAESQRMHTRPYYLKAQAGHDRGPTSRSPRAGSFVVCTNEGNADLSANLPKLHIASIGIEKLIPKIEHLGVFIRMLSRSALGSPITQITSHFRAPRPGTEMHVVLVDNGRSERWAWTTSGTR